MLITVNRKLKVKMMKKITILTLQNVRNYGSVLQALATQALFEDLGWEVDFFNYYRANISSIWQRCRTWNKNKGIVAKIVLPFILIPTFIKLDKTFLNFLKKYLHVQKQRVSTIEDFKAIQLTSDIYCTGSDQTWNSDWNDGILPEMFLEFVPDSVKKISYAASMGKGQLDEWEKAETKRLLQRYSAISVRESTAVDIINELGITGAVHVLDPTLQMPREFWMKWAKKPKEENYVLIYQLNTNPQFDAYASIFAKQKGLKLLRFCTRYDQIVKCGKSLLIPNVEDFVSYIAYAECVITDSFHATAFSINLNTNFISIYPNSFSSRLASILEQTGLQHRHLTSYDDFSFVENMNVNFAEANRILDAERVKAIEFLRQAIAN